VSSDEPARLEENATVPVSLQSRVIAELMELRSKLAHIRSLEENEMLKPIKQRSHRRLALLYRERSKYDFAETTLARILRDPQSS
jgi:hypothetical protein